MTIDLWAAILGSAAIGFIFGLLQWLVLRKQFERANTWIIAAIIGNMAATIAGGIPGLSFVLANAVRGGMFGAVTGGILVWLLQNHRRKAFTKNVQYSTERPNTGSSRTAALPLMVCIWPEGAR
jgi:hypothetical protein